MYIMCCVIDLKKKTSTTLSSNQKYKNKNNNFIPEFPFLPMVLLNTILISNRQSNIDV